MKLTSRDNALVRHTKKLLTDATTRRAEGLFAIEGARLCADAALSGVKIRTVLYTASAAKTYATRFNELQTVCNRTQMFEISNSIARSISNTMSPQGIFCICESLDNLSGLDTIKKNMLKYLALENIQDPTNMGTIIRTAEALGINGLLLSKDCCDIYNPKVLRGSMGGVFRLPMIIVNDMADTVIELQIAGMHCWACVLDSKVTPLPQAAFKSGCICLIGNEGNGLRPDTVAACEHKLTIPMGGRAESLNAAMAASIIMWEMIKKI